MRFASSSAVLIAAQLLAGAAANVDLRAAIEKASPETKQCAAAGGECRTAAQVAPRLLDSFAKRGVRCRQEAACLTSLVLLETDHLRYQHNVSPGRPGQGTGNMQMCQFNVEYARSEPALAKCVAAAVPGGTDKPNDSQCRAVLACILGHEDLTYDTPAWFMSNKCADPAVRAKLRDGAEDGCSAYLQACVGVDGKDAARAELNRKVYEALGVAGKQGCVPLDDECKD